MRFWVLALSLFAIATAAFGQAGSPAQGGQPAAGAATVQVPADYTIGAEDVFDVTVLRHIEFSGEYYVPQSGIVNMPVLGNVNVSGMTPNELVQYITKRLKSRLLNPEVSVSIKLARMQRVYVFGNVKKPGVLDLKPGWKVTEAISSSGGLEMGIQSSDIQVTLERTGQQPIVASLADALSTRADDFLLKSGDVLRVDAIPLIAVYVTGQVRSPGLVSIRNDSRTPLAAVAQAGGITPEGSSSNVKIIRLNGTQQIVNLTSALVKSDSSVKTGSSIPPLPILNAGDMIVVPESQDRIAVLGYVQKPGYYLLPEGHVYNLAEAIALASGPSDAVNNRARLNKIGLIRREGTTDVRMVYDLGRFFKVGDKDQNPIVRPGDIIYVPESRRVELTSVLTGLGVAAVFLNLFRN